MYNKSFLDSKRSVSCKCSACQKKKPKTKNGWLWIEKALQNKQLAGVNVIVSGRALSKPQQCFLWREKERNEVSKAPVEKRAT